MIVTAALIWYDEKPEDLVACVRGIGNIADRLVAVDGAYRRYPDAQVSSPPEQAEAIRATAAEVNLECDVHVPDQLWAGQVEKRSFVLNRASQDSDWIAVVDSDWVIHAEREKARDALAGVGADVVSVPIYTPKVLKAKMPFASHWHRREANRRYLIAHLYRAFPGWRVEKKHWNYSALKNGQRVWMWNVPSAREYPVLPAHPLGTRYIIEHRTLLRDERHIRASRAFLNDRLMVVAKTGQEDDVPGLPPPVFDYETVSPQ